MFPFFVATSIVKEMISLRRWIDSVTSEDFNYLADRYSWSIRSHRWATNEALATERRCAPALRLEYLCHGIFSTLSMVRTSLM
jgi:hypothetical protein